MFKRTKVSAAAAVLIGGVAALNAGPVLAQETQRIEITGSAIKRIDAEGSLPVTILRREDIERSGATTVTDLIQRLPGMAGGTTESAAVGGGGGGFAGASVHNIGETRTLVLLNGRRLANFGGQSLTGAGAAVDLNTLPLSAIDRVEVLTDGASALYGSDAVAGVVNFITRRDVQDANVSLGYSDPKGKGAEETRFSISKGFGDLDKNGFNVFLAFSADKRKPLNAVDAQVGKTGVINFKNKGTLYQAFLGSSRGIPANTTDDAGDLVSPYFLANGTCAPGNVPLVADPSNGKTACYFDFVAQLEVFPERKRQNFMATTDVKLGNNHTLFADLLLSKTDSTGIIAPVPGELRIAAGSPLFNQYLAPLSGTNGSTFTTDSIASYRVSDLGRRADDYESKFKSFVVGTRGTLFGSWDYEAGLTWSKNDWKQDISGYPGALAFSRLLDSGLLNPFVEVGNQTPEALEAINRTVYKGNWDGGTSELRSADFRVSSPLANLSGGPMALAAGLSFYNEKFQGKPSPFAQGQLADPVAGTPCDPSVTDTSDPRACDQRFGDSGVIIPYSADRNAYGIFAELNAPVTKTLELTAAVRYDKYDEVGNTTNGKLAFKWRPVSSVAIRGSVGTGFKAPTVPQLHATRQSFGVTSAPYNCTPELLAIATSLGAVCRPPDTQYDVVASGNPLLKPEKSKQATLGVLFEPAPALSLGADLWWVGIRDAFGQIAEDEAFRNPGSVLWTTFLDIATNTTYLAYDQSNLNLGKEYRTGLDLQAVGRTETPLGRLTGTLRTTYMIREKLQLQPDGPYYSPIGVNHPALGVATFRWSGVASASLRTGNWTNTLGVNFKSGYKDATFAGAEVLNPDGTGTGTFEDVTLRIGRWETFDWQTQWQATKQLSLTAGVLNFTNKKPPLSLAEGGNGKGQHFGYDDRYYDIRGRTLYVNGSFTF